MSATDQAEIMKAAGKCWLAALVFAPCAAMAQEPAGCDKFKFPVDREQAALADPQKVVLTNGGALDVGKPFETRLASNDALQFEHAPERTPAPASYGAVLKLSSTPVAGDYTVSLSAPAWLDVLKDGAPVRPSGFSGVKDCPNIRKVLKYQLSAKPTTIQISNVTDKSIAIVVLSGAH